MKYTPYPYQAFAEKFVLEHKAAGLFLDMGLGKTAITLSACEKLLRDYFETSKVLVIAPLLPARETWPDELAKWDQLDGLTYSLIIGTAQERIDALHTDADFYIVNRENVVWLVDYYKKKWPFDKKAFMNDCYGNEFVPYVVLTEKMLSKIQSSADIYEQVKKMTTNYRVWNDVADYLTECFDIITDKVENAKAQG